MTAEPTEPRFLGKIRLGGRCFLLTSISNTDKIKQSQLDSVYPKQDRDRRFSEAVHGQTDSQVECRIPQVRRQLLLPY